MTNNDKSYRLFLVLRAYNYNSTYSPIPYRLFI